MSWWGNYELVLERLAERITPERLQLMLAEARRLLSSRRSGDQAKSRYPAGRIEGAEGRLNRLYDALESGIVELMTPFSAGHSKPRRRASRC